MDTQRVETRSRMSTGQLQQPRTNNPAYRKPTVQRSGATQRILGGQAVRRESQYDPDSDPRPTFAPGHSAIHSRVVGLSPARAQRKRNQQDSTAASNADANASPRRSRRIQETEDAVEDGGEHHDQHRDYFPDPTVQKHAALYDSDTEPEEGAETLEAPRSTRSKRTRTTRQTERAGEEQTATPSSLKKKRGRPRKTGNLADNDNGTAAADAPSGTPRRSGRLAKTASSPAAGPERPDTPRKSGRPKGSLTASHKLKQRKSQAEASGSSASTKEANVKDVVDDFEGPDDDSDATVSQRKGRKRKAPRNQSIANTAAKRRKVNASQQAAADAASVEDVQDDPSNRKRWYEEYLRLQGVFGSLKDIGRNVTGKRNMRVRDEAQKHFDLEDGEVKTAVDLCTSATTIFDQLKDRAERRAEPQEDPAGPLTELSDQIDVLCEGSEEVPFDRANSKRCCNIYAHLVPSLVKLLRSSLLCYEKLDQDDGTDGQITTPHLQIVNGIIKLILVLIQGVRQYNNPPTEHHLVEPVRNRINPPLRQVHAHFHTRIQIQYMQLTIQAEREDQARQTALRLEQEERRSRQQARIAIWQTKWLRLHEERFWADGGILSEAKRKHLALPKYDIDQNGMRFERAEVFHPRVGPPPGLVDLATRQQWTMVQLSALADGLKLYTGPHVFERIFRKYCRRGAELDRYNVTEIVTTAANLRDVLTERGEVEEWVTAIPMWTKTHEALGKENEEIQQGDNEAQAEDGLFVGASDPIAVEQ